MASKAMELESPRIPHLAPPTSEIGDLRADVDDAFERVEVVTDKVSLTVAEIKALAASPKELVAAPGAGKILQFMGAMLKLTAGSEALTETDANLAVKYTDDSGVQVSVTIEATGFIDQTVDTWTNAIPDGDAIVAATGAENQALVLDNIGAGEYAGNASDDAALDVYVSYKILTV